MISQFQWHVKSCCRHEMCSFSSGWLHETV